MKMTLRHNFAREIPTRGTVRFADPDQHGSGKGCGSPSLIASFFHLSSMQLLLRGKQPKKIFRPKKSDKWKLGHFIYRLRPKSTARQLDEVCRIKNERFCCEKTEEKNWGTERTMLFFTFLLLFLLFLLFLFTFFVLFFIYF